MIQALWSTVMRRSAVLGMCIAVLLGQLTAVGQVPGIDAGDRPVVTAPEVGPPAPIPSMAAFNVVEGWVKAWQVGGAIALPPELGTIGGCAVTLRLDRKIVGRGVSFMEGVGVVADATRLALDDAAAKLPVVKDATELDQRREIAKRITISLELAGPRTPLVAATYGEVDSVLEPGLDGVAVTVAGKVAGVFPSEMMITNRPPSDAVISAASEASGDATLAVKVDPKGQPGELAKDGKASFQKFRVTHIAQVKASGGPAFLFRGGRVIPIKEVLAPQMVEFAGQLAGHLHGRMKWQGDDLDMVGSRMPFQGRDLQSATTVEWLITTAALARFAQREKQMSRSFNSTVLDLHKLRAATVQGSLRGPVESAAWVIASREVDKVLPPYEPTQVMARDPNAPPGRPYLERVKVGAADRAQIGARLASGFDVDTGWSAEVPEGARGFVAYALVIEAQEVGIEEGERAARLAKAEKAVRAVFEGTPAAKLAGQMPWLGFAELELGGEVKAAAALQGMRDLVWKHQLDSGDSRGEVDDLIGGIVFTTTMNPLPTAQSVRPVLVLARMARDRRVTTEAESMTELSRLLNAVRFLRQLAVDETSGYACPDVAGLWGVRSSLWDQRQPAEATALTLWSVCEVLDMVEGK